ncbi:hypothetical protein Taro_050691 [Colocasia esculenta]|uniref:Uncharacterized protein n=1 Tax=Colocasia esculenta TaxID=4460 RepID=A0A843XE24_COLES|nr:hypothetical protein [Colocasia esculenta]
MINENYRKKIIAFENVPTPHTADNIDKKLYVITMDNASNNNAMVRDLRSWFCEKNLLVCHDRFFHIQCSAHILNLIVYDSLNVISKFIEKIHKTALYIRKTSKKKEAFKIALFHGYLSTSKGGILHDFFILLKLILIMEIVLLLSIGGITTHIYDCLKVFYNATLTLFGTNM